MFTYYFIFYYIVKVSQWHLSAKGKKLTTKDFCFSRNTIVSFAKFEERSFFLQILHNCHCSLQNLNS